LEGVSSRPLTRGCQADAALHNGVTRPKKPLNYKPLPASGSGQDGVSDAAVKDRRSRLLRPLSKTQFDGSGAAARLADGTVPPRRLGDEKPLYHAARPY
jgi:hypothetical protein